MYQMRAGAARTVCEQTPSAKSALAVPKRRDLGSVIASIAAILAGVGVTIYVGDKIMTWYAWLFDRQGYLEAQRGKLWFEIDELEGQISTKRQELALIEEEMQGVGEALTVAEENQHLDDDVT